MGHLLVDVAPHLIQEWHTDKNYPLDINKMTASSGKKVWWTSKCGHDFQAVIGNRVNLKSGCPFCAGKQILIGFNDLNTTHPMIASEFHPTKNYPANNQTITAGSNKKVWWLGTHCGHEWEAKVLSRTISNSGCPICSGRVTLPGFNDLTTKFPHIAEQWHPTLNGALLPTTVSGGSHAKAWWIGDCGHEWEATIVARTAKNQGCPVCSSHKVLAGYNDLASAYPAIALDWHPSKNESLKPQDVSSKSNKKVWWLGQTCQHEWSMRIANRTASGQNCPVCSNQQVRKGINDLQTYSTLLTRQWHPMKNGNVLPSQVGPWSGFRAWWIGDCGHEWEANISSRQRSTIAVCPSCSKLNLYQGINDLSTTHPTLVTEWHPTKNDVISPSHVTANSNQKAWWICKEDHEWATTIRNRAALGYGCPSCSGKITVAGFNDLETIQPLLAAQWHPTKNDTLTPNMVTIGSGRKVWWLCSKEHEWQAAISDRATHYKTNCPECNANTWISKAEHEIASFLIGHNLCVIQSDRKILQGIEMDIYIPEKKIAIEYNGIYWHTEDKGKGKSYHYDKWLAANNAGIQLIQIWEDDWNKNPEQIKSMLLHKLGISTQKKIFARNTTVKRFKKADVENFLDTYHIQGFSTGSYYIGLVDQDSQDIVSVAVLKKDANNSLNIVRYATSKNVVGGFTKLLKFAEINFNPSYFVTFSDHCVSDGGLYANNGFTADRELPPDYRYVVKGNREHKFGYRLKRFRNDPTLHWTDGLTERELAKLNNIPRIWDAGKTRWIKQVIIN